MKFPLPLIPFPHTKESTADTLKHLDKFWDIFIIKRKNNFRKGVENVVVKGEKAYYEKLLLWLQCFQKMSPVAY